MKEKENVKKEKTKKSKVKDVKNNENKVKFSEKLAIKFKRKWLVTKTKTLLIIAVILMAYITLNLWCGQKDLPQIDMTENKVYTLSDASKKAIEKVDQEVNIYIYGLDDADYLINFIKQYTEVNDKITCEILNEESNYEMVQKYGLQQGYQIIIMQSGDSEKVIDASTEFTTYDYTTYQSVDTKEQTLTNSILSLIVENKPKVYFVQGHGEYDETVIATLTAKLQNEAFEVEFVNLATEGRVPEDCDILAIISPSSDLFDAEAQYIKDYINNGGNMYVSMDVVSETISYANLQTVLDLYGVAVKNGYILECEEDLASPDYPYIFIPQMSTTHEITKDIYTDSTMWLVYAAKLEYKDDATLESLGVTKETLLNSTEKTVFITDLSDNMENAASTAQAGSVEIASAITKTITKADGNEVDSKLIIASSSSFISDYTITELNQSYPLSYIASNLDFAINSMAHLGDKENLLTIRKDFSSSTYTPTAREHLVVILVIVGVPIIILLTGIIVWVYRKKRK